MNKNAKTLWGLVAIVVVVGLVWYGASSRQTKQTVRLGFVGPLTGDVAVLGVPMQKAALLAQEEINAAGRVGGKPLDIKFEDGLCNGKDAAQATQKLLGIDGVKFIIGGSCSGEMLAMAPLVANGEAVLISPSATSPKITTAGDFVFRNAPSDALQAAVMARYAYQKLGLKKAAVISENTDYGQGLREAFKKLWTDFAGQIAADEVYNTGETDFRTVAKKLTQDSPEAIYIVPNSPASGLLIAKQVRGVGYQGQLLTAEVLVNNETAKEASVQGLIHTDIAFGSSAKTKIFLDAYKARYGTEPEYKMFVANTYTLVYLFKEAIEKAGENTAKVRDFLYDLKDWDSAVGKLTFDKNGDPASASYAIKKVLKGEDTEVEVVTP